MFNLVDLVFLTDVLDGRRHLYNSSVKSPLTFTWPHLRCDVGLEEGEY